MKQTISTCTSCKKPFNNPELVPWCGPCNEEMNGWEDHQNKLKKETAGEPRSLESSIKIQSSPPANPPKQKRVGKPIQKNIESGLERDITPTPKPATLEEPITDEETERPQMTTKELTIMPTASESEHSSMPVKTVEILPEDSTLPSVNLSVEVSRSMNLLNQSENELFASMKGLRSNLPEPTIRLYEPERVQTAVLCGRQIVESMKTKIELMKFAKEIGADK